MNKHERIFWEGYSRPTHPAARGLDYRDKSIDKTNMKKTIEMSLETAREIWKTVKTAYKTEKDGNWNESKIIHSATSADILMKQLLENNFTLAELEGNKGYTWEESYCKAGWYISHNSSKVHAQAQTIDDMSNKCVFKTKEQAESALAFAQLSHIVSKYNEGKKTKTEVYTIQISNMRDCFFHIATINYGSDLPHMIFYDFEDAKKSLDVNKELWKKYWMTTSFNTVFVENE